MLSIYHHHHCYQCCTFIISVDCQYIIIIINVVHMSLMFLNTSSVFIVSTLSLLSTPYNYHQCPLSVYHHFHYQYIITFINVLHMPSTSINTSSVFIASTSSLLSMPHVYYVCPLSVHHHYNQHGTFIIHVH